MPAKTAAPVRHLTSEDLAGRLGIDADTLKKWRRDGRGPAYIKDGDGFVRYRESDVVAWEESRLHAPAST